MSRRILSWLKKETVFTIAAVLALGSMLLEPPDASYIGYVDVSVLAMLFSLMLVVGGFQKIGLFAWMGERLAARAADTRSLSMILVFLCFFSSMLITNDVALLTFVPFAVMILHMTGQKKQLIPVIVFQTIAANLGSMLTPVGNPQNLYLYSLTGWDPLTFMLEMLPFAAAAFVLLLAVLLMTPKEELRMPIAKREGAERAGRLENSWRLWLYIALFLCCMAAVANMIPNLLMLLIVCAALGVCDRQVFRSADYALLATFVFFFIFIGNMQRVDAVRSFLEQAVAGRELLTAVCASQMISNVPAAILLSGFTDHYRALLWGTNIGGLGTLIASLASLISYKCYVNVEGADKGRYLAVFTLWNVLFLAALLAVAAVISAAG